MKITSSHRALARDILRQRVDDKLEAGSVLGPVFMATAAMWFPWTFKGDPTADRWAAAVIQREAVIHGINAGKWDAFFGPQTADAAERLIRLRKGVVTQPVRPDEVEGTVGAKGGSTIRCWSPSTSDFMGRYGPVGESQQLVRSPYLLRLDWDLEETIWKFSAHASLTSRIESAMAEILACYGIDQVRSLGLDRFGGCLNVRLKRGGSTPSTHSWGVAIDWFPSKNQLKQSHRSAFFAKADYFAFFEIWEKWGFMSLGRCFDFDWMHVQANP
jgi:hypothetical protein